MPFTVEVSPLFTRQHHRIHHDEHHPGPVRRWLDMIVPWGFSYTKFMLNILDAVWEGIDFQKYMIYIQNLRNSCQIMFHSTFGVLFIWLKKPSDFAVCFQTKKTITFNCVANFMCFFSTPSSFAQEKKAPTAKSTNPNGRIPHPWSKYMAISVP